MTDLPPREQSASTVAGLRNVIYKTICNSPPFKLVHCGSGPPTKRPHAFLSLAHVNQQLRREFLPIYYDSIRSVQYCDASHFVQDFVLPRNSPEAVSTSTFDIDNVGENEEREPDMLPLLKYLKQYPDSALVFNHKDASRVATLHQLFRDLNAPADTPARTKWSAFMDKYVKELCIAATERPRVQVVVKHAVTEFWMGRDHGIWPDEDWVRVTGFPMTGPWWEWENNE